MHSPPATSAIAHLQGATQVRLVIVEQLLRSAMRKLIRQALRAQPPVAPTWEVAETETLDIYQTLDQGRTASAHLDAGQAPRGRARRLGERLAALQQERYQLVPATVRVEVARFQGFWWKACCD